MLNQKDLSFAANKRSLNKSKTQLILFCSVRQHQHTVSKIKLNNFVLEPVKSVKYLGIEIGEIFS